MMGTHLLHHHRLALETLEATADAQSLEEEQIHQWLDALEVLRLVLGTQLDVTEDTIPMEESGPLAPQAAAYRYLSMLQEEIVDSLAQALPRAGTKVARGTRHEPRRGPSSEVAHDHGIGGDGPDDGQGAPEGHRAARGGDPSSGPGRNRNRSRSRF